MKKFFTCFVLLFAIVTNLSATVIWEGEVSYANGRALPEASNRVTIGAEMFASAKVGDFLYIDVTNYAADATANHVMRMSVPVTYEDLKHNTNVSEGDHGTTVYLDANLLEKLQSTGLVLGGSGFTVKEVSIRTPHDNVIWEGEKVVTGSGWTVGIIPVELFANVEAGYSLLITARKTNDDPVCVLESRGNKWPALSADDSYSNTFTNFNETGESKFSFPLNAEAAQALKENGMIVDGNNYTLLSVALLSPAQSVNTIAAPISGNHAAYTLDGVKVAENVKTARLQHGVYIVDGKKIVK